MGRAPTTRGPRSKATRSRRLAWLLVAVLGAFVPQGATSASRARLSGRVVLDIPELSLSSLGPVVVYLEPGPDRTPIASSAPAARIEQMGAHFNPPFLVVEVGQRVDVPNFDTIYHNAFSYSRPNDFDLGIYPTGESRSVVFHHPGVVKAYCSIHETMNATILVAPSPHYAVVGANGRFELTGVRAGSWILRSWSERFPGTEQTIELAGGEAAEVEIRLASGGP